MKMKMPHLNASLSSFFLAALPKMWRNLSKTQRKVETNSAKFWICPRQVNQQLLLIDYSSDNFTDTTKDLWLNPNAWAIVTETSTIVYTMVHCTIY